MLAAAKAPIANPFTILCLVSDEEDFHQIEDVLRPASDAVIRALNCEQTVAMANANRAAVVICTESFGGSNWRSLLNALGKLPSPPSLIVLRSSPDPALWAEVLLAGGFDVLCPPIQFDSLLWVVAAARRRWERNREVLAARKENLSAIQRKKPQIEYLDHTGVIADTTDMYALKH